MAADNAATIRTIITDYYAQLATDAARTRPAASYFWEGRRVDRNEWRLSVLKAIQLLNEQLTLELNRDASWELDVQLES